VDNNLDRWPLRPSRTGWCGSSYSVRIPIWKFVSLKYLDFRLSLTTSGVPAIRRRRSTNVDVADFRRPRTGFDENRKQFGGAVSSKRGDDAERTRRAERRVGAIVAVEPRRGRSDDQSAGAVPDFRSERLPRVRRGEKLVGRRVADHRRRWTEQHRSVVLTLSRFETHTRVLLAFGLT